MWSCSDKSIRELLISSGVVLEGHFLLSSGRHSAVYFEKFRILEQPKVLAQLCELLVEQISVHGFDVVVGPATGGMIVAYEMARQLDLPAVYVESEAGVKKLRRSAQIRPGDRALVVDDVLTTGLSVGEVLNLVQQEGGFPIAVAVLLDRSELALEAGLPLYSACRIEAQSFTEDELPDWLRELPITKPGTRK